MSTWNFPCWQTQDPIAGTRQGGGQLWEVGPGALTASGTTQPFTNTITCIFSMLVRSGWTSQDGGGQGIFSIGYNGGGGEGLFLQFIGSNTNPRLQILGYDTVGAAQRYIIELGDEDGITWFADDKWYQIGISINSSGISYAVNGSNTPKVTTTTNVPGAMNFDDGNERIWAHGPTANWGTNDPTAVTVLWPSVTLGASAFSTTYLDFDDATVRDLIWDSNGDFLNPGEDGSLWFNSTYGSVQPEYFFTDGSPRFQKGTDTQVWGTNDSSGKTTSGSPAGLRKQYE